LASRTWWIDSCSRRCFKCSTRATSRRLHVRRGAPGSASWPALPGQRRRLRREHFLQDGENLLEGGRRELAQAADEACAIDRRRTPPRPTWPPNLPAPKPVTPEQQPPSGHSTRPTATGAARRPHRLDRRRPVQPGIDIELTLDKPLSAPISQCLSEPDGESAPTLVPVTYSMVGPRRSSASRRRHLHHPANWARSPARWGSIAASPHAHQTAWTTLTLERHPTCAATPPRGVNPHLASTTSSRRKQP
jgi:hypothetical protein